MRIHHIIELVGMCLLALAGYIFFVADADQRLDTAVNTTHLSDKLDQLAYWQIHGYNSETKSKTWGNVERNYEDTLPRVAEQAKHSAKAHVFIFLVGSLLVIVGRFLDIRSRNDRANGDVRMAQQDVGQVSLPGSNIVGTHDICGGTLHDDEPTARA